MSIKKLFVLAICVSFFIGCNTSDENAKGKPIARAYDKFLYKSELADIVPNGVSPQDSILIAKNFIQSWIRNQVILNKAEKNLTEKQKDFKAKIEEYRNSLVIYSYENQLIAQELDTVINQEDIQEYYSSNQKNFELKENIMRVTYVKLPVNSPVEMNIRNLYRRKDSDKNGELKMICDNYAVNYFVDDSTWLYFNDLLKEMPIRTYNQEQYLKNHRFVELRDTAYLYFLNIKDFKIKESLSPLSLEVDNIKNIIINKRKIELIDKMHKDILKTASENNDFETFN